MANKIPKIITIENKQDAKFLRRKTADFDFKKYNRKEIGELIKQMREEMEIANGIGLSANQIGLDFKLFVVQIPQNISVNPRSNQHESASTSKFYAVFNPEITKFSKEKTVIEEGCLSVPGVYGLVERPEKITLVGQDKNAKKIKIKAWGLLARVFQHETDHLNGILFIDRCKKVYAIEKSETRNPKL
jgi:peptide deformylase